MDIVQALRDDGAILAEQAADEIERICTRNAALIEVLRDRPCPVDARSTIGECQQCGCSAGLLMSQ